MELPGFLQPLWALMQLGGPVLMLLAAVSVIALALIGLKLLAFSRLTVGQVARVEEAVRHWRAGRRGEARSMIVSSPGLAATTAAKAMQLADQPDFHAQRAEEEIERIAVRGLHELQRGFKALDAIAQTAPLLGLFGTVLGMIQAFQQLQAAGATVDPAALAGGIWVALLTTAAGLAIAMPVSLVLSWLESRVDDERVAIESMATAILAAPMGADGRDKGHEADAVHAA